MRDQRLGKKNRTNPNTKSDVTGGYSGVLSREKREWKNGEFYNEIGRERPGHTAAS